MNFRLIFDEVSAFATQNPEINIPGIMQSILQIVFFVILQSTGISVLSLSRCCRMFTNTQITCRSKLISVSTRRNCVRSSLVDEVPPTSLEVASDGVKPKNKSTSLFVRLGRLLSPGEGQSFGNRAALHASNARRKLTDPQMWTHIFFVMNGLIAYDKKVYDLFFLTVITAPLSVVYHYSYEKPGRLAQLEGSAAKALFMYGFIQIFRAPTALLAFFEVLMMILTVAIFVGTNLRPNLYEPYHCFMHVIPPIWATVVALTHTPIFKLI